MWLLLGAIAGALPPGASAAAEAPKGDVVFVIDESGSMRDEIADVRGIISSVAEQASDRVDARYALVGFGGGSPGVPPNEPFTRTDFTTVAGLNSALQHSGAFAGNGGGDEMGLDATTYSMMSLSGFRQDAASCAVVITDEPPSFRANEALDLRNAIEALANRSATWFGVVDTDNAVVRRSYGPDPGSLSALTGGSTFSLKTFRSDPSSVLTAVVARCAREGRQTAGCTIRGTRGADTLRGTAESDVICGLGGDDIIRGRGGDDTIKGGAGNDVLRGQQGADRLLGGSGDDRLFGGEGRDLVHGQRGRDRLHGNAGRDLLSGGSGRDRLAAADGRRDTGTGGPGADVGAIDRRLDRLRSIERTVIPPRP